MSFLFLHKFICQRIAEVAFGPLKVEHWVGGIAHASWTETAETRLLQRILKSGGSFRGFSAYYFALQATTRKLVV
jgi:hypothetical protein